MFENFQLSSECKPYFQHTKQEPRENNIHAIEKNQQQQFQPSIRKVGHCDVAEISINVPDLQIYSASLQMSASFSGFQYLLYQWPVISFMVGTVIMFGYMFIFLIFILAILSWKFDIFAKLNDTDVEVSGIGITDSQGEYIFTSDHQL